MGDYTGLSEWPILTRVHVPGRAGIREQMCWLQRWGKGPPAWACRSVERKDADREQMPQAAERTRSATP
jgi:hypothetical protein